MKFLSLLFQLNEIDMKNGREMVTSQKTRNLSNLEKKVNQGLPNMMIVMIK